MVTCPFDEGPQRGLQCFLRLGLCIGNCCISSPEQPIEVSRQERGAVGIVSVEGQQLLVESDNSQQR